MMIALWPWVCLIAWELRRRYVLLAIILPFLFCVGSYAKHSFAICALSTLGFLWIDALREDFFSSKAEKYKHFLYTSIALLFSGLIYIAGRSLIIPSSGSNPASVDAPREIAAGFGFSFWAPVVELTGIEKTIGALSSRLFGIPGSEELYPAIGSLLALLALCPLVFYIWLSFRKNQIERFTGLMALFYCAIMTVLLRTETIGLRGRYFQPIVVLLIIVLGVRCFDTKRIWHLGSRVILVGSMVFGLTLFLYRCIIINSPHSDYYRASERLSLYGVPPEVLTTLRGSTESQNAVIFVENPMMEIELIASTSKLTHFFRVDRLDEWHLSRPRQGRVPRLILPIPPRQDQAVIAEILKGSFVNYHYDEWNLTVIEGWQIWQATTPL